MSLRYLLVKAETDLGLCHCCHCEQSWMSTLKEIARSEPALCTAISLVSVLVLKRQRKPQPCNLGTPKLQPRALIWPGSEVAQLPPKVRSTFCFSGSSLDINTKFLSNITFPVSAQACIEEIMMSSQKLKSINLKVKNPILVCITNADELFKSAQKL